MHSFGFFLQTAVDSSVVKWYCSTWSVGITAKLTFKDEDNIIIISMK